MSEKKTKNDHSRPIPQLREDELAHSGVAKILLEENNRLRAEIDALKKSLKNSQNALEDLRSKNNLLDKENSILNYRLTTIFLPEFLKFLISTVGGGFAVNYFFNGQINISMLTLIISVISYGGILFLYRR